MKIPLGCLIDKDNDSGFAKYDFLSCIGLLFYKHVLVSQPACQPGQVAMALTRTASFSDGALI